MRVVFNYFMILWIKCFNHYFSTNKQHIRIEVVWFSFFLSPRIGSSVRWLLPEIKLFVNKLGAYGHFLTLV